MTQSSVLPAYADLSPEESDLVAKLQADPQQISWRAECFRLGSLWFEHEREPEALTALGLELAPTLQREEATFVTELFLGYAAAREAQRAQEDSKRWRRRVAEVDGLHRIMSAANSTLSLDSSLDTVVQTVAEVMGTDVCSVFLFDRDRVELWLRATHGLSKGAIGQVSVRLGQGITGLAAQEGRPIAVDDVQDDPRVVIDWRLDEQHYRSIVCIPIILFARHATDYGSDHLQGVISVQTVAPRTWSQEEVDYLEVVAGELTFFIANAQRYQETDERLHQKIRELTTLQRVSGAIATTLDLQTVLNLIVEQAVLLPHVDRADIFHHDQATNELELLASCGGAWDERLRPVILRAIIERHPLAVAKATEDVRFPELTSLAVSEGFQSLFCIPLRSGERITGAIALYARQQRYFDYEEVQLLSTFADDAAIAVENARLYREAQRSLQVKSTLLQELHHRVRNNLSNIGALLQMQLRRMSPESPAAMALAQSVNRIQAIALVHNLLVHEEFGITTIQEIARQVVDALRSGMVGERPVHLLVKGDPVSISSREATLLALIINELIDNALSHGLAAEGGLIEVEGWLEGNHAVLEVRDDGPQHPGGPIKSSSGLGQSIIDTLVTADLSGTFTFNRDDQWARARIVFPYVPPTSGIEDGE